MKKTLVICATLLTAGFAGQSFASDSAECGKAPESEWMTKEEITAKANELGYDVSRVKVEDGCYEIYTKKDGKKLEVFFNPVTGEVVRVEEDD